MSKIIQVLNREFSGAVMATLIAETRPKLKAGSPSIIKRAVVNGVLNFDYARAFEKRTGNLPPGEKPWFSQPVILEKGKTKRIPLVFSGKKQYIRIMVLKSKIKYFDGGRVLSTVEANSYLAPSGNNPTNIRVYHLENIKAIRLHGKEIL